MTRDVLLTFVRGRLAAMASHLGTPARFSDRQPAMLAELSGTAAGCAVPNDPVTSERAAQAVQIARRYVFP